MLAHSFADQISMDAHPAIQVPRWLWSLFSMARVTLLLVAAILSHSLGPVIKILSSVAAGVALGLMGFRKGSLSQSGNANLGPSKAMPL